MKIVGRECLVGFRLKHADAAASLNSWVAEANCADWGTPPAIKQSYPKASILKGSRCVFNICGNKYRLIVKVNYSVGVVQIRWIGKHADYDQIDAGVI